MLAELLVLEVLHVGVRRIGRFSIRDHKFPGFGLAIAAGVAGSLPLVDGVGGVSAGGVSGSLFGVVASFDSRGILGGVVELNMLQIDFVGGLHNLRMLFEGFAILRADLHIFADVEVRIQGVELDDFLLLLG